MKKAQQQLFREGNLGLMKNRKEQNDFDFMARKEKTNTTIGAIGDGYQQQLLNMQKADAINNYSYA